ncbi:MAG: FHA domain-containing protein, partial [Planctomycetota bacterium]
MSSKIRIQVAKGADAGRTFEVLKNRSLVVGRGSKSDTKLIDPEISRVHFSVEYNSGRILVADLGSSTGTYLNGVRIDRTTEADTGDEIMAGGTRMFLSVVGRVESDTL